MSNTARKLAEDSCMLELNNLSNNILKKMVSLNTTLPELANMIGIEYQTLWRITNPKNNYMPTLRVLLPIANFFNVTVADLLKNPNMPQYIPIIDINKVSTYISSEINLTSNVDSNEKILCNEYIHEQAFALNVYSNKKICTTYIFKPYNKINKNIYTILRYKNEQNLFVYVNNISGNNISATSIFDNEVYEMVSDSVVSLAIAVKQIMNNDLI